VLNTCPHCGLYRPDKIIDPAGPFALCPECGHRHPFKQLPLLIVSGASGAGKTTVCQALLGQLEHVVLLDTDILWRAEFNQPENGYADFFETWLRMAKNIGQAGRPVVLFGAGVGVPANLESRVERRYFSVIHYLALVCDEDALAQRLGQRPAWRGSSAPGFRAAQLSFNQWFKDYSTADPPLTMLDTTRATVAATTAQVSAWISARTPSKSKAVPL
jgi:hypothetical protein